MSFTLETSRSVLLSLHLQHDIVSKAGKFANFFSSQAEERNVIKNCEQVINEARLIGMPVIHAAVCFNDDYSDLHVNGPLLAMVKQMEALKKGEGAAFFDEVAPYEGEYVIEHQRVGPFEGTNLSQILKDSGSDTVILFGVATNIVVETTARIASDKGYNVIVVEDCCSAATLEAHKASLETLSLLATITTRDDLLEKLKAPSLK
ncbi:cysteine hydrolase family protein [Evansella cellulosilytica]|uniref:Isochorismatase hydrolase n=1 Tax=Evansella cellulosilytica (strain ATCC 21833 / DSM 2522 / FERM P-1141 / JCM 9156 / N-4) TaxID=649639 RepID=E6U0T4_EVAC2|nr:cysteine hydrolase [Evansella cellulosilytica]ADU29132.1 isochorismatase hydrolase [Evansella cellulosilytica DSM 2522]